MLGCKQESTLFADETITSGSVKFENLVHRNIAIFFLGVLGVLEARKEALLVEILHVPTL